MVESHVESISPLLIAPILRAKDSLLRLPDSFQRIGSFGRHNFLIHGESAPLLHQPAGPTDFELVHGRRASQTEVRHQAVLGVVATPAHHFAHSVAAAGRNYNPGPDTAAVGF